MSPFHLSISNSIRKPSKVGSSTNSIVYHCLNLYDNCKFRIKWVSVCQDAKHIFMLWCLKVIELSVKMLKKASVRLWLICGWMQSLCLVPAAMQHQPPPHRPPRPHQRREQDLNSRGSLGSSLSTRLNQTFRLCMEMDTELVNEQFINMVFEGPSTTFE